MNVRSMSKAQQSLALAFEYRSLREWLTEHSCFSSPNDSVSTVVDRAIATGYFSDPEIKLAKARARSEDGWETILVAQDYIAKHGQPGDSVLDAYMRRHPDDRARFDLAAD